MAELLKDGRRVSLEEAARLTQTEDVRIWWRPEDNLDETEQYALVYGE